MATNKELEAQVNELREEVEKQRRVLVELANALHRDARLTPAQVAVVRKVLG